MNERVTAQALFRNTMTAVLNIKSVTKNIIRVKVFETSDIKLGDRPLLAIITNRLKKLRSGYHGIQDIMLLMYMMLLYDQSHL